MTEQTQQSQYRQPGINKIILTGNLTHDPELKQPGQSAAKVCVLRLAVNGRQPSQPGRTQHTDFFRVDVWGSERSNKRPEAQAAFLRKGRQITVIGRMQVQQVRDPDTGRISQTYHTVIADEISWGAGGDRAANPVEDSVVAEQGTPDSVAVEAPVETAAEEPMPI
jgi:single stranded DNA-binding protein